MASIVGITAGDVSGIGPEVIVRALHQAKHDVQHPPEFTPLLIGHPEVFRRANLLCGSDLEIVVASAEAGLLRNALQADSIDRMSHVLCVNPGDNSALKAPLRRVSAESGEAAFRALELAIELARNGTIDAIATAPLNKEALHLAGHHFPGHTEILADRCGVDEFAMMLHLPESSLTPWRNLIPPLATSPQNRFRTLNGLSIVHVTLHTSIESVPRLLSVDNVVEKTRLMSDFLRRIRCERSAIAVCALNPHGGENGLFGNEEQTIIAPAVRKCASTIPDVCGPLPVDTLMRRAISGEFDGIVAMYHDQGHIPVKLIGFDSAINITLGLPIIRTSPTHGTAFDRAWNRATPADGHGMLESIRMASTLAAAQADSPIVNESAHRTRET